MQTPYQTPLELGATVYGSDGEKIGDIAEVQSDYFVIEKGFIFTTDIYIPSSAVVSRDENGVRLSLTKGEIDDGDWSNPPVLTDQEAAGPVGYAGQHTDGGTVPMSDAGSTNAGATPISGGGTYATDGVNGENGYDSSGILEDDETKRP